MTEKILGRLFLAALLCVAELCNAQMRPALPISGETRVDLSSFDDIHSFENIMVGTGGVRQQHRQQYSLLELQPVVVPIKDIKPFLALGIVAEGEQIGKATIQIMIRYAAGSGDWSDWQTVNPDEVGVDPNRRAFALSVLPKETKRVQATVIIEEMMLSLQSVRLSFINPGESQRIHEKTRSFVTKGGRVMPLFMSRTDWQCPDGQVSPRWMPLQTTITHLIVHHTATTNSSEDWPAVVRSIWIYHANTLGWGDIGYNWLIDPTGMLYQGRAWYGDSVADVRAGHFCGVAPDPNGINNNEQTMGVAMIGTFMTVPPSVPALQSLRDILFWKVHERALHPEAIAYHVPTDLMIHTIAGHREGCATDCPGDSLYTLLPGLRQEVDSMIQQTIITMQKNMPSGWNLVSLPDETVHSKNDIFPEQSSSLFMYSCTEGYIKQDTLRPGSGYWIYLPVATGANVRGEIAASRTMNLSCNWNIIGAMSQPLAVSSIHTLPENILASGFYSYDSQNGYTVADTLMPFQAYWVKVHASGTLLLSVEPLPSLMKTPIR